MAKERPEQKEQTELSWITKMRWASKHHVIILEASLPENDKRRIFHISKKLRLFRNELVHEMQKRVEQLFRTKKYRRLSKALDVARGKLKRAPEHSALVGQRRDIIAEMRDMQHEYRITWNDCREASIRLTPKFNVPSIFALTKAEDVWHSISRQISKGVSQYTPLKFRSKFDWVTLRAKQTNRGISVALKNNRVWFSVDGLSFTYRGKGGDFVKREMAMVEKYMASSEDIDEAALNTFKTTGVALDTFRPCYVTIVPKEIRGRLRVFLHMVVEGASLAAKKESINIDHSGELKALAKVRDGYEKRCGLLRAKMEFAKKATLTGKRARRNFSSLRSQYQDAKRKLRDVRRRSERIGTDFQWACD